MPCRSFAPTKSIGAQDDSRRLWPWRDAQAVASPPQSEGARGHGKATSSRRTPKAVAARPQCKSGSFAAAARSRTSAFQSGVEPPQCKERAHTAACLFFSAGLHSPASSIGGFFLEDEAIFDDLRSVQAHQRIACAGRSNRGWGHPRYTTATLPRIVYRRFQ